MYDVIVIGARCAGAPTAMLLARRGYRVLLCDRAGFPSDTVSTGAFQLPGINYLRRWGLLDALRATGVPPVAEILNSVGRSQTRVALPEGAWLYGPRRGVLDALLVQAALEAGVEFAEATTLTGLERDDDGRVTGAHLSRSGQGHPVVEHVRLVVGADGRRSSVARLLGLGTKRRRPMPGHGAYAYYEGLPTSAYEFYRPGGPSAAWVMLHPSSDGLTCVTTADLPKRSSPRERLEATLAALPDLNERVAAGRRVDRVVGYDMEPIFYRRAHGPGWALVGDAGFHQGPTEHHPGRGPCLRRIDAVLTHGELVHVESSLLLTAKL